MPSVSFIIPLFNCEKTLKRCLSSIFAQETKLDYEVILIEDASTDSTRALVKSIVAGKQNAQLINLEQPVGISVARNIGIQHAQGDFLFFIDARDALTAHCLRILSLELCNDAIFDVLIFMYRNYSKMTGCFSRMRQQDAFVYDSNELPLKDFQLDAYPQLLECTPYIFNLLVRRAFIEKNNIQFFQEANHSDRIFRVMSLVCAKNIRVIHDVLYVQTTDQEEDIENVLEGSKNGLISSIQATDAFFQNEGTVPLCYHLPYAAQKFSSLVDAIQFAHGRSRKVLEEFLQDQLRPLDDVTASQLKNHRLSSGFLRDCLKNTVHEKTRAFLFKEDRLLLSIIIPVYNTEPWLRKCLQSVVDQTLPRDCFEVILVDDKSTDHSLEICWEFCRRYTNFRLIELPENTPGGAGIPSNRGLDAAKGVYVGFVDSDDFIEPTMFEELLCRAEESQADLTLCGFNLFYEKAQRLTASYDEQAWSNLCLLVQKGASIREIQKTALLDVSPVPWRKLYRRAFLEQKHIRYPEGKYVCEDNPLHWFCVTQATSMAVVDKVLITHRFEREGQTMESGVAKRAEAMFAHARTIGNFLEQTGKKQEFRYEFLRWVLTQGGFLPNLGRKRRKALRTMKELCSGTTLRDMRTLKAETGGRLCDLLYDFMLTKGLYQGGRVLRYAATRYAKIRDLLRNIFL